MKSLINSEYLKNIYNCIGKNVNNVFVLRDNSFNESEIEYISDGCIYLEFDNQIIKFTNKSIEGPDLDDYPNLDFEVYENLNDNNLLSEFSLYALNITGIINDIKIVNDEFSSWWNRISDFWVGKSPDFKYFYRKEISICDRLTIL